jgi:hypothetical protein
MDGYFETNRHSEFGSDANATAMVIEHCKGRQLD